jgi:hypothetical protein
MSIASSDGGASAFKDGMSVKAWDPETKNEVDRFRLFGLLPAFDSSWVQEFDDSIRDKDLIALRAMSALFGSFTFLALMSHLSKEDDSRGGNRWALLQWGGYLVCVLTSLVIAIVCGFRCFRPFAFRNSELLGR